MNQFRRYSLLVLLAACVCRAPRDALAAPFCTQISGMAPQCLYFDPGECRDRAHQLSGVCTANPDELKIVPGSARYCLVNASRAALCIYPDLQSCDRIAAKDKETVCIDNGLPQQEQDPFRTGEPERRY